MTSSSVVRRAAAHSTCPSAIVAQGRYAIALRWLLSRAMTLAILVFGHESDVTGDVKYYARSLHQLFAGGSLRTTLQEYPLPVFAGDPSPVPAGLSQPGRLRHPVRAVDAGGGRGVHRAAVARRRPAARRRHQPVAVVRPGDGPAGLLPVRPGAGGAGRRRGAGGDPPAGGGRRADRARGRAEAVAGGDAADLPDPPRRPAPGAGRLPRHRGADRRRGAGARRRQPDAVAAALAVRPRAADRVGGRHPADAGPDGAPGGHLGAARVAVQGVRDLRTGRVTRSSQLDHPAHRAGRPAAGAAVVARAPAPAARPRRSAGCSWPPR